MTTVRTTFRQLSEHFPLRFCAKFQSFDVRFPTLVTKSLFHSKNLILSAFTKMIFCTRVHVKFSSENRAIFCQQNSETFCLQSNCDQSNKAFFEISISAQNVLLHSKNAVSKTVPFFWAKIPNISCSDPEKVDEIKKMFKNNNATVLWRRRKHPRQKRREKFR